MSSTESRQSTDEYVYIDLDEPANWWQTLVGLIAVAIIISVLVAPWMIDLDDTQADVAASNALQDTRSICRPDTSGMPTIFDPSVASWGRFCDWFIDPQVNSPGEP